MNKRIKFVLILALLGIVITGCKKDEPIVENVDQKVEEVKIDQFELPKKGEEIAIISTNHGDMKVRLFPEIAPKAVENFITHSKNGYYDNLIFHRVIKDFMIQGGDPTGTGAGGESIWEKPFEDEFDIRYRNFYGALSMANAGENTNGSQFFIVQKKDVEESFIKQMEDMGVENGYPEEVVELYKENGGTPWLDFGHTVFGQVFEGLDVLDKIANLEVDSSDKPLEPVVIKAINIVAF